MRLVARKYEFLWIEDGEVVAGHRVERMADGPAAADVRYLVRSREGRLRMLVSSQRAFLDRRERSHFRRLAAARVELQHPAAVPVHAVSQCANRPVLIADVYPARTFADLLRQDAPLAAERAIALLAPVAQALDLAHASGLVHQALAPDALLLYERGELVLDDFGLLQPGEGDMRYRSPEQIWGQEPTAASNVYSLTALLFHALTGDPPYDGDGTAVMYRHVAEEPPRVSEAMPDLGAGIDAVVARGLAKDPLDRPFPATELLHEAADALGVPRPERAPVPAVRPRLVLVPDGGPPPLGRPRPRPFRAVGAAVGAAVVCGALAAAVVGPFGENGSSAAERPVTPAAWKHLAGERAGLRDTLAVADTPQAQAEAASGLAGVYEAAARTGEPRALAAAAREAALGYNRLAAAAELNDDAGYAEALVAVERAEGRLSSAASRH